MDELKLPILSPFVDESNPIEPSGAGAPDVGQFAVGRFDDFFSKLYEYYYKKGLIPIILSEAVSIINLGFTGCLTTCLFFIDWPSILANCKEEATCSHSLRNYMSIKMHEFSSLYRLSVVCYISLFVAFFVTRCVSTVSNIGDAFYMEEFFVHTLGFKGADVQSASWSEVMEKIILLHREGLCLVNAKKSMDELEITGRIMRKSNYLIALINKDVLDIKIPWYFSLILPSDKIHLTTSLRWCLEWCLLDHMFNENYHLSGSFLKNKDDLARRFLFVGLLNFILLPFMIVHMTVHFFLSNAQQSCNTHLGERQWSSLALWKFREFNELQHIFDARINRSYQPANQYISTHSRLKCRNLLIVVRCIMFMAGAFVSVLLVISALREEALLYIHVGSHNLLWWLGLFSSIYVGARQYTNTSTATSHYNDEDPAISTSEMDVLVEQICASTHYYPARLWHRGCPHTFAQHAAMRDEIEGLFPQKITIFAHEILSVVLTPIILCFSLPPCAPSILQFIHTHTRHLSDMGAVVDYSVFDNDTLEKRGDEKYGAVPGMHSLSQDKSKQGKLESSFISFQQNNPRWKGGGQRGRQLVDRIAKYREVKEREREVMNNYEMGGSMLGADGHLLSSNLRHILSRSIKLGPPSTAQSQITRRYSCAPSQSFFTQPDKGDAASTLRSILHQLLREESIPYEDDHYWLNLFGQDYDRDPDGLEKSLVLQMQESNSVSV